MGKNPKPTRYTKAELFPSTVQEEACDRRHADAGVEVNAEDEDGEVKARTAMMISSFSQNSHPQVMSDVVIVHCQQQQARATRVKATPLQRSECLPDTFPGAGQPVDVFLSLRT